MSVPMIVGLITLYLFVSRCLLGFFYAVSKGVNITKDKDRAAVLIPPFGEFLLLWGLINFLVIAPVSMISGAGVKIHKWREDRAVKAEALAQQRQAYELELARYGLTPDDVPSYIESGDLKEYVDAQREAGLLPKAVDLDDIRKKVKSERDKVRVIIG